MAPSRAVSTNPHEHPQPRLPIAAYREVIGLLLLLVGLALVLVAAYRTDVELGLAVTGVLAVVAGVVLSIREV